METFLSSLVPIIKQAIMITSFVMVMMLIIEFLNVKSRGNWAKHLKNSPFLQLVFAAFMGVIPGCLGAYTVVSLYAHGIVKFAALVTVMIATSGDEAFVMFSVIPEAALWLNGIIFIIAILVGWLLMTFGKRFEFFCVPPGHMVIHEHEVEAAVIKPRSIWQNLKNMTFTRALLIGGIVLFLFALVSGVFGHDHASFSIVDGQIHKDLEAVGHHEIDWVKLTFIVISLVALFIFTLSSDHFLEEHLWGHVIKKHFLKILLWTLGALLLVNTLDQYYDVNVWISDNLWLILLAAVLIGIVPESGPHFIFIILFFQGMIPFSILLASSIVQDGHGALPLLAESRKSFFVMKAINVAVGLIAGGIGLFVGF
ncbi:MAG: arsenic efflux protein [Bacteroidales bacterium]|nr:arsenic efflux protein [Bacteroidales bacterium]